MAQVVLVMRVYHSMLNRSWSAGIDYCTCCLPGSSPRQNAESAMPFAFGEIGGHALGRPCRE